MKTVTYLFLILYCTYTNAQTSILTVNSGSIIASNSVISVGEIVVNPVNPNVSSSSGIIGILAQTNQTLEVAQFDLTSTIIVFPNPTMAAIYFQGSENLHNEDVSIYDNSGRLISQTKISADNSLNLESLASGIYLIQFTNKNYNSFKIIKH